MPVRPGAHRHCAPPGCVQLPTVHATHAPTFERQQVMDLYRANTAHIRQSMPDYKTVKTRLGTHKTLKARFGTCKTVKARFGTYKTVKARFGTYKTVKARFASPGCAQIPTVQAMHAPAE